MSKPVRLSKESVLKKAADLWYKFHDKLHGCEYHEYMKEVLDDWNYQNSLSDADLIKYREKGFKDAVTETRNTFKGENEIYDKKEEAFDKKTSQPTKPE